MGRARGQYFSLFNWYFALKIIFRSFFSISLLPTINQKLKLINRSRVQTLSKTDQTYKFLTSTSDKSSCIKLFRFVCFKLRSVIKRGVRNLFGILSTDGVITFLV